LSSHGSFSAELGAVNRAVDRAQHCGWRTSIRKVACSMAGQSAIVTGARAAWAGLCGSVADAGFDILVAELPNKRRMAHHQPHHHAARNSPMHQ